jgi:putative heme-binding domain-containing protein
MYLSDGSLVQNIDTLPIRGKIAFMKSSHCTSNKAFHDDGALSIHFFLAVCSCLFSSTFVSAADKNSSGLPGALEAQVLKEDPKNLAQEAQERGDPARGAVVFFQPALTCMKCHTSQGKEPLIGPDLSRLSQRPSPGDLVDSILRPSKAITKGFESVTVVTKTGIKLIGLLVEDQPDRLILRDSGKEFSSITILKTDIEERSISPVSIMPAGLVNQLGTRQQFLDLVRYLMEITEKGPARARELQPDPALLVTPPLPEYEKDIDHAGLIRSWNQESLNRGRAIYDRLCINCHGTKDRIGSLPTALRFSSGQFKNGCDPYSMYQTLTRGFGMMTPQTWMVPRQKYDVIHYIRETYLKESNPSQYVKVDGAYLGRLPKGKGRGPEPSPIEPWINMDYGPVLMSTFEVGRDGSNFAYKGIAIRLDQGPGGVARGRHWMLYDHDTMRVAAAWSGQGFIDWNSVLFTGQHEVHPHIVGEVGFANPMGPGWANPTDGTFRDGRLHGRDGKPYGPLPRDWAHYQGLYLHGQEAILSYTVGTTSILETPGLLDASTAPIFTRTFNIGSRDRELVLQIAREPKLKMVPRSMELAPAESPTVLWFGELKGDHFDLGVIHPSHGMSVESTADSNLRLHVPAGKDAVAFVVCLGRGKGSDAFEAMRTVMEAHRPNLQLQPLTQGSPPRWLAKLTTKPVIGKEDGPFAIDALTHPEDNPWFCRMRFGGFDFLLDGQRAAICTWDGDVWLVDGIDHPERGATWQRIASGLFQPLGLKVVNGQIYVACRDQIVRLHDLNGDGEIDFFENFNNDHQVTEHFHEFAMGLQTDAAGNFYYGKGGRHALTAVVPHHGTLLRVSKDGSRTTIVANGFRAPNGVCVNSDGSLFITDQEGHWTPKNRINWVVEGGFYGYMWGYHNVTDASDQAMKQPLCWITNSFDRSPAEMLWVDSKAWGPLNGALLNLSYGTGKIFVVPHEKVNGIMQGGMCRLPMPLFPTGVMRGRFHPENGQLYACGLFVWAGNQEQPGGFYRVRYTGKPLWLPLGLKAKHQGIEITFSDKLERKSAEDVRNYIVKTWSLKRTAEYGSPHFDERPVQVTVARLAADKRRVFLEMPGLALTQCMEIKYFLRSPATDPVEGVIHNTVHQLGD